MKSLEELRRQALKTLQEAEVLMHQGHFDYGNGFHGRVYLNPHQLFRYPSTIWRLAQDLLDVLPADLLARTEVVAGPATGGALLAHTLAGLLDGRRTLTHPALQLRPFHDRRRRRGPAGASTRSRCAAATSCSPTMCGIPGRRSSDCAAVVREAGGIVLATVEICDRMEAVVDAGVPNFALAEYPAPENHPAAECPMCRAGEPITASEQKETGARRQRQWIRTPVF